MKHTTAGMIACVLAVFLFTGVGRSQVQDPQVRTRQGELRAQHTNVKINNELVKETALDKPAPRSRTALQRENTGTGYDYTQVKGYTVTPTALHERIDKVFQRASEMGLLNEQYYRAGANSYPCETGLGTVQIRSVEMYAVESTQLEMETLGVDPYNLIEVRVITEIICPERVEEEGAEEGEDAARRRGRRTAVQVAPKQYILAGRDLWTVIRVADPTLEEDLLMQRTNEKALPTPDMRQYARYRGPFIVRNQGDLETAVSRFADFWNKRDTLRTVIIPETQTASGPVYRGDIPLIIAENTKKDRVIINNPDETPLQIMRVEFIGDNADKFRVLTKTPILLEERQKQGSRAQIDFEYVGDSEYETKGQLSIQAQNTSYSQIVDVIVNAGKQPADVVVFDLSLDRLELRSPARSGFAPDWKIGFGFGNPEIGLPRWTSGMSTLSVGYKHQMSVGLVLPMNMTAADLPGPMRYDNTFFFSPMGYNIAFDFTFGFPFSLGGSLTVTDKFDGDKAYQKLRLLNTVTEDHTYTDNFFNLSTVALLYYPIMFKDRENDPGILVRFDLGGGFVRVERNLYARYDGEILWPDNTMKRVEKGKFYWQERERDIFDIYVRVGFINTGARNNYGLGVQYFSGRMMADAWLELTEWLRVEAKYSFLLRAREVWESENSFLMVTPRLRLAIPSLFK
ncbi:MAG: hypothetical protein QHI48_12350 [Bacteroidota bacterium]|nr:hypothetical protein [Bacteroidota bacterium]